MSNSKRKCKHCKEYTREFIKVPAGAFCDYEHAIAYAGEARIRNAAKALEASKKADREKHRADKQRIKPKAKLEAEAQQPVNEYVRLRDYWLGCVSCSRSKAQVEGEQGWKVGGAWDAGHYRTRGAAKQLRFNLHNIHKQCKKCNAGSSINSGKAVTVDEAYTINLARKIGIDKVVALDNNNEEAQFSREYYERIKTIFRKRVRIMKKRINRQIELM